MTRQLKTTRTARTGRLTTSRSSGKKQVQRRPWMSIDGRKRSGGRQSSSSKWGGPLQKAASPDKPPSSVKKQTAWWKKSCVRSSRGSQAVSGKYKRKRKKRRALRRSWKVTWWRLWMKRKHRRAAWEKALKDWSDLLGFINQELKWEVLLCYFLLGRWTGTLRQKT